MLSQLFNGFILKFDVSCVSLLAVKEDVFLCHLRYLSHSVCREKGPEIQVTLLIMVLLGLLSEITEG